MNQKSPSFIPVLRLGTIIVSALSIPALFQVWKIAKTTGNEGSIKFLAGLVFALVGVLLLNLITWSKLSHFIDQITIKGKRTITFRGLFVFLFSILIILISIILDRSISLQNYLVRILDAFWMRAMLLTVGFFLLDWIFLFLFQTQPWKTLGLIVVITSSLWQILSYFPASLNFPFSLDWSEISWYYYASFFSSKTLYGVPITWPFLDIGKPLLLSAVYLLPNSPLWLMRIWQFILWIGIPMLVAFVFHRRIKPSPEVSVFVLLWIFLWMLLGPVYFHLGLGVAIVLLKFDRNKQWKSILWVGLASLWTGVMRINWIPVPAMLALALYFLETPKPLLTSLVQYLKWPALLAITSVLAGLFGFIGYTLISGRADTRLGSKLSAPFLWFRLWPNETLQTGIVLGALLVSIGVLVCIYISWKSLRYAPIRFALIGIMLGILFAGGVFASAKIGGGNNLHNLDAFLVLLMVWGVYAMTNRILSEHPERHFVVPDWLLAVICMVPALWSMQGVLDFQRRDVVAAQNDLVQIREIVQMHADQGEPVLFISQRHLLTFGMIPDVPVVQEYELLELMEMAMSENRTYLQKFQNDLKSHQFGLVIMNYETGEYQEPSESFANENNAWMRNVYLPLMEYYNPLLTLQKSGVVIYTPDT